MKNNEDLPYQISKQLKKLKVNKIKIQIKLKKKKTKLKAVILKIDEYWHRKRQTDE